MQIIQHEFRACTLRVFPETEYVETVYRDGAKAPATRDSSEMGNVDYARHLGYPDCWTALVSHEAAHTLIAERMGHLYSPTLWAVAHDYAPGTAPYEERLYEEALTLAVEKFANTGQLSPILRHPDIRPHYSRWAWELKALRNRLLQRDEAA